MSNGSTTVIHNCQVIKSNKTYTLRESPKRSAKDRMRLHESSHLLERDSQYVFFTKKGIIREKECHEHYTVFMIQNLLHCIVGYKAYIYCVSGRSLHAYFHSSECIPKLICFISCYKCIDFSLYTSFQNPMSYLLSLGWVALLKSQPLVFL